MFVGGLLLVTAVMVPVSTAQATSYPAAVLADNPIAYYRATETAGAIAVDSIGGANDGTYLGSPNLLAPGPRPPAFLGLEAANSATGFNGSSQAINTPVSMSGLAAFTLEAWVRPTVAQSNRTGIVGQNDALEFGFINQNTIQIWTPANGALNVAYSTGGNAGQWVHLAAVGTGTQKLVYVNGVLAGSQNHGAVGGGGYGVSGHLVNIAGDGIYDGGGNWFEGDMDEVALYRTALSAGQIEAHYKAALVPEPLTMCAVGLAVAGLGGYVRRRQRG